MSNTIPVDIEFVLKNMNFQEEAGKMKKGIQGVTTTAQQEADKIQGIYKQMAAGIGVYFSARFLKDFITSIAQVRGEFQQLEVSLQTILRDKSAADRLMQQVVNYAATTPFELQDVAKGTKQLLAYGFAAGDVINTFKTLGDVSAGLSVPIGDLIYLYGTLNTQGRAYTRDILQFTSRGIPIIEELASQFGVAKSEIQGMVEAGKVGFKDVETAFKSMTGEGGKFEGLVDAISEKIPTLAANYQDAVTRALNGIGKNNEETIAAAISGATTLVNHYEEILDVLKVLVTTYGAYKAATIAVAVAENFRATSTVTQMVSNGIKMVQVTRQLTAAQWLAAKSSAALKASMLANPYILAATAIAGLVTLLTVFGKETKKVEDYVSELNNSIDQIGKQEEVDQLIKQYETLSGKANRTADEQKTLNSTIQELGTIFPDAIGKTDEYGKAVDLVAEKLRDLNKEFRDNLIITTTAEIEDNERKIRILQEQQKTLLGEANAGQTTKRTFVTTKGGSPGYIENEVIGLSPEEIKKKRNEVKKLDVSIKDLQGTVQKGRTKLIALNAADADEILSPYKNLFQQASDYSREQALQVKADLVDLLDAGLGINADQRIKDQIQAIDTQLGLPTVKKQIAETTTALAEAQAKLVELRADSSQATSTEIEDQEKLIKALTDRLATLTGVKQKEADKQIKAEEQRLKAMKALAKEDLELTQNVEASKVAYMKEGAEKRKREAEVAYQAELTKIQRQEQDYLGKLNESKGLKLTDKDYITELPQDVQEQFDKLRLNAEKEKNTEIEKISRDTAREVEKIWEQATEAFISQNERDVRSINNKYDELIKKAKELGKVESVPFLEKQRGKEIDQANANEAIKKIDLEEEIETKKLEIGQRGYRNEQRLFIQKLELLKKYAAARIKVLSALGGKENKDEISRLSAAISVADKSISDINNKLKGDTLTTVIEISDAVENLTHKYAEQLGLSKDQVKLLDDIFKLSNGVADIASGNIVQGAAKIIESALSLFVQAPEKLSDHFKAIQEQIDDMLSSIDIATQSLSNMGSSAVSQSLFSIQRRMSDLADEAKRLNDELGGASYSRRRSPSYVSFYGDLVNEATSLTDEIQALSERLIGGNVSNDQREAIEAVLSSYNALMAQIDTITQEVTGTTVQNLADSLADVFLSGEDAAVAWGEKVDEVIKNVIVKQLTADLLTLPIQDAVKQLIKDSTDGERTGRGGSSEEINIGLTPEEAANFRESVQEIYDSAQPAFQAMIDSFSEYGFDFGSATNSKGLTGAIKGITEETAGLIAGHLTGLRFDVRAIVAQIAAGQEDTVQRISYLKQIADNTKYNKHLVEIKDEMIGMHKTLKDGL
ncbi:tape measure protein [Sunxiuqinia indica]|uniref:tape measure protein n=1 Tax=Sunxiuqinia indica TaxID=2692584 RepID=UPI00135C8DBE|nr:tape measure protein [Sunxiuqinia indica]